MSVNGVQNVVVNRKLNDVEQFASEQLREVARGAALRGATWAAWAVVIDEQAADLLETGGRMWLVHGDRVVESHALPTETPEGAVWRLLDEHARAEAARDTARQDVWCWLYSRCLTTCDSAMSSARADDALDELATRGLVEAMRRVATGRS